MAGSGADLERARMLARAGISEGVPGYDGAILEQLGDIEEAEGTEPEPEPEEYTVIHGLADISHADGVDNTGVLECSAAIMTAIAGVEALGAGVYWEGDFRCNSTIKVNNHCNMKNGTIIWAGGAAAAFQIGENVSANLLLDKTIITPIVRNPTKVGLGWAAGRIGVIACNTQECDITVSEVEDFETGYYSWGLGAGNAYNKIRITHLNNNKRNLVLGAGLDGWSNSNTYLLGSLSHNSEEGVNVAGTRQILIEVATTNIVNGNLFIGGSIEGAVAEYEIDCAGTANRFQDIRYESAGGAKVIWRATASRNTLDRGYDSHLIVETHVAGSKQNHIISNDTAYFEGSSDNGVLVLENFASNSYATDVVMESGSRVSSADIATAYRVYRTANFTYIKRAADAYPRIVIDHDNGRFYFGPGTAMPTGYIGQYGSGQGQFQLNGSDLLFNPDNTKDIGWDGDSRPRDIRAARDLYVGGKMYLTGEAEIDGALNHDGTHAGFFGVAPVTRPTAPTATVAAAPAGGAGAAAGAWSSAVNRDAAIATINNTKTRLDEVVTKLQALGLIT